MSRRMRPAVAAFFLALAALLPASAQSYYLSAAGGTGIPLGVDAQMFSPGGAGSIGGGLVLSHFPRLLLGPGLAYSYLPLQGGGGISAASAGLQAELGFDFARVLSAGLYAEGGYYLALLDGASDGNPYAGGGISFSYRIADSLRARIGAGYRNYFGLYSDIGLSGGVTLALGAKAPARPSPEAKPRPLVASLPAAQPAAPQGASPVSIVSVKLDSVFPVFFKHYDENPLGTIVVKNASAAPAEKCRVEFLVKQYMDNPKLCAPPFDLAPGEERSLPVYALFTDRILEVTEGTKVSATLSVSFEQGGKAAVAQGNETLSVMDRNAIVWDDDRRAAAFVTAKDPQVMRFARVFSSLTSEAARYGLPAGLLAGAAMHEALAAYGIKYIKDPTAGYAAKTLESATIDFMQFPSQTLSYKGGDCDDLTVLYCALLQAIGMDSAFITVPGHIYAAVDLGMDPAEARKRFSRPEELILEGGRSWLPIEVTMTAPGFLNSWQEGAREWREAGSKGLAKLYPVSEAWKAFVPVGFAGAREELALPGEEAVVRYIDREIFSQVAQLQAEIKKAQGDPRPINKLGILYARFGLFARAKEQFALASAKQEFVPSLVNLGNLSYLDKDLKSALASFQRAYAKEPGNPTVILALARANHELENYGSSRDLYERLKAADPALASRFSYLDLRGQEANRAANAAGLTEIVVWSE
jgi:tetratricopeptide (TPR) repeat protein